MAILGALAKAIGSAGLDAAIEHACNQLEQFVKGLAVGKTVNWSYTFSVKGKSIATINVRVQKTRNNINIKVGGVSAKLPLSNINEACSVAVAGAIHLL